MSKPWRKWVGLAGLVFGAWVSLSSPIAYEDAASRIFGAALVDGRAWEKLAFLCDRIGPRLSGSPQLERAVRWSAERMRLDGADKVWTEPVMVPHWIRGFERARIESPIDWRMELLALGGSVATPAGGVYGAVVEVVDLDELSALGDSVRGKIVLFNRAIVSGFDGENGYGSASGLRVDGPSAAARQGAIATLIRSLGTANFRLAHTGALRYADDAPRIPAAAISAEDAELIHRLIASGSIVRVRLELGCQTLPDAESANVLAELTGRERPDEIVLIAAHLDSWDVGQGAHDDGAGCAMVMETMALLARLETRPRRTIRAVLFTNEENGARGGRDYAARHGDDRHVVALETDSGAGPPIGFGVSAGPGGVEWVRQIADRLAVIGADQVAPRGGGADIGPLEEFGVPLMSLMQDPTHYFDWHHTHADTLDKVDRAALDRNVAALAVMTFALAERESTVPRPEPARIDR